MAKDFPGGAIDCPDPKGIWLGEAGTGFDDQAPERTRSSEGQIRSANRRWKARPEPSSFVTLLCPLDYD
ncbi:MAG: hypothetical protein U0930_17775 [Pirellulales bacterium]